MPVTGARGARGIACAVLCLVGIASGAAAADDTKASCARAAEAAQAARIDGRLLDARKDASECARDACPGVIARDCRTWASELAAAIPSVVVRARDDAGLALSGVRVKVDDAAFAESSGAQPVPIDPGAHRLAFEVAGYPIVAMDVSLRAGEKRSIDVVFAHPPPAAPAPAPPVSEVSAERPAARVSPALRWTLFGVGAAGLVAFGVLGVPAHFDAESLRDSCAPHCAQSDVDSIRTRLILGDVGLGIGVLGLGAAAWLTFFPPHHDRSTAFQLVPVRGGAASTWRGSF